MRRRSWCASIQSIREGGDVQPVFRRRVFRCPEDVKLLIEKLFSDSQNAVAQSPKRSLQDVGLDIWIRSVFEKLFFFADGPV